MSTSEQRAAYERALGIAHKWLWVAHEKAEMLGDDGACEDIANCLSFLTTLTNDSLRNSPRAATGIPGQLSIPSPSYVSVDRRV